MKHKNINKPRRSTTYAKQNMNKYKTLASNTMLISVGTFGSKLLVFFMVRFYTGYLTPSDYGTADLITQTANLLFPLISLGITDGVFRFAIDKKGARSSVLTTGLYTITAGSILFVAIVPLLRFVPGFDGYIWLIALFTMASCYHALCAQYIRGTGNTMLFAFQGIINTALVIGLNILFLAVFSLGITGYVLSVAIANLICTAFLILKGKLWRHLVWIPKRGMLHQMLRYSIPLIPTTVFWWITSVSDRYMVSAFLGIGANGIYAVAYKIPTILTILSTVFMEAWQFSAVTEAQGDKSEHILFYSKIWSAFQAAMFVSAALVIAFSQAEIRLLATDGYYSAWNYIPLLSAAMVFASFSTFMGSVYVVTKKSTLSFWTAMAGAVLNIILNLLLIPSSLGIQGAAVATFTSYFAVFVIRAVSSRRLIPFRLYTGGIIINSTVLAVQITFILCQFPMWRLAQAAGVLLILLFSYRPLLTGLTKLIELRSSDHKDALDIDKGENDDYHSV